MPAQRLTLRLWILLTSIHLVWFCAAIWFKGIYLIDSRDYLHQAYNLQHYSSWYAGSWSQPIMPDYFSFRLPLYAAFISVIKYLIYSDYAVLIFQNVLSIVNMALIATIAKRNGVTDKSVFIGVLLSLFFFPMQFLMSDMIMSEILFQTLLLGLFLFCYSCYARPEIKHFLAIGVLLSLLLLTKPVSILLSLVAIPWCIYCRFRETSEIKRSFISLAPLVLVPFMFHFICLEQEYQTGYYHYSSIKPVNQFRYNARFTLASQFNSDSAQSWMEASDRLLDNQGTFKERYELMEHLGDTILKTYPVTYAKRYFRGITSFLLDPDREVILTFLQLNNNPTGRIIHNLETNGSQSLKMLSGVSVPLFVFYSLCLLWNGLVALSFVLFITSKRFAFELRILIAVFVGYMIFATGMMGLARYRASVFPELMLCTIFVLDFLLIKNKKKIT